MLSMVEVMKRKLEHGLRAEGRALRYIYIHIDGLGWASFPTRLLQADSRSHGPLAGVYITTSQAFTTQRVEC